MELEFPKGAAVELFVGGGKTGKTLQLARKACELAGENASVRDVLVLVASPDAVEPMSALLRQEGAAGVRVATPRQVALDILGDPHAQQAMGRGPRVLARYEESFLMEDMKVSGLRPGRIRELVGFLYRSWTELADFDEGWLIFKEEQEVEDLLSGLLASYRAYVEPMVANAAVRWLLSDEQALGQARVKHVLVDDYQTLSRASQYLANLLAGETLTAAANPVACARRFESYPYAAGVAELQRCASQIQVTELTQSLLPAKVAHVVNCVNELAKRSFEDEALTHGCRIEPLAEGDEASCRLVVADGPAEECAQVVAWVRRALDSGLQPAQIAVAVPNRTWERNMANALAKAGVPTQRTGMVGNVGGDIRYDDLSQAAQFMALLTLAADRTDEPSLRAWCGFGEYLTNRSVFQQLFEVARNQQLSLDQVLANVSAGLEDGSLELSGAVTFMGEARKVAARYDRLQECLAQLQGLTGQGLVNAVARLVGECLPEPSTAVPAGVAALVADAQPEDDAGTIARKAWSRLHFPAAETTDAVRVATVDRVPGMHVKAVALTGMVNGFYPKHVYFDRTKISPERADRMLSDEAKSLVEALAQSEKGLGLFAFKTVRGVDAERQDLRVERFFVRDGVRYAALSTSAVLTESGAVNGL